MPPKQRTKGQKEVYTGNQETLKFYGLIATVPNVLVLLAYLLYYGSFSWSRWIGWFVCGGSAAGGVAVMFYGAKARFSPTGQLLDAGMDLSMTEGTTEYVKDLIIFSGLTSGLSVFSGYFLLLWFVMPAYAFYLVWVNFLWPWIHGSDDDMAAPDPQGKKKSRVTKVIRR